MTFNLDLLTWISIGMIYSSRIIYLPCSKFLGQSVLELSIAQGEVDWHDLRVYLTLTFDLLTWISIGIIYSSRTIYQVVTYQVWSSGGKRSWVIGCTKLRETDIPTDGPTDRPTCAKQYAPPSSKGGITRAPRGTDRSPEYKEHFCYKLDSRVKYVTTEWNQKKQHFVTHALDYCYEFGLML